MKATRAIILLIGLFTIAESARTQEQSDSARVPIPVADSLHSQQPPDSVSSDTLGAAERAARSFEERMKKAREQAPKRVIKPRLSVKDSLASLMLPQRLDQREWLSRSYYMNASDYFKFSPGFFVQRWQLTPGRSTVQPYGLAGDRLSYVTNGMTLHPFEHTVEPDGTFDLEDLSTALDGEVFIMPGASGMLFGADQAIASLVTTPIQSPPQKPMSSFLLDKGNWGFSHARGRYAHTFSDGKQVRLGIGYRVADGARVASGSTTNFEDAYAYDGEVYLPVTQMNGLMISGHLYHRQSPYLVRPDSLDSYINRDRFDRNLSVHYLMSNDSQTVRTDIGYRHVRQGSYLGLGYRAKFNLTGHGLDFSRQWYSPTTLLLLAASVDRLEYDNAIQDYKRHTSEVSLTWARPHRSTQLGARVGGKYVEEFRVLPYGSILLQRESKSFFIQTSIGYAERAPSQHELYLPFKDVQLYGLDTSRYADGGDPNLKPERQVTGSFRVEFGSFDNAWIIEAVGGGVYDGIEWDRSLISLTTIDAWYFTPVNTDVTFATVSTQKRVRLGNFANVSAGGSYFWREYDKYTERPYQPDYQLFGGMELHHYWQSKLMHFWAYGEIQYVGPYSGYQGEELGEQAVVNGKLSFSMGNFRFRVVYQNFLNIDYANRELFNIPGRVITWGFDWNFFD